jgi:hypothetical protein
MVIGGQQRHRVVALLAMRDDMKWISGGPEDRRR